nr:MAG TPA: hypothetical protein [Caudoviricetes sp.]
MTSTPPTWRGFSFALHLLRVQGFYFARRRIRPTQAFTTSFLPSMQLYHINHKTVYKALQRRFRRFDPFQRIQYSSHTSRLYTACATLERITAPLHLQRIPDTTATPDAVRVNTVSLL